MRNFTFYHFHTLYSTCFVHSPMFRMNVIFCFNVTNHNIVDTVHRDMYGILSLLLKKCHQCTVHIQLMFTIDQYSPKNPAKENGMN